MDEKQAGIEFGASSGCPFCRAASHARLATGTRFRLLSGHFAGQTGVLVPNGDGVSLRGERLARVDGEPAGQLFRKLASDLIEPIPAQDMPTWYPPLKLRFAADLDSEVVAFCKAGRGRTRWVLEWEAFIDLIGFVWSRRLPLEPNQLWALLSAHGVPHHHRKTIIDFYTRGRRLLIRAAGKGRMRRDVMRIK